MKGRVPYLWGPLSLFGAAIAIAVFVVDRVHKWAMFEVVGIATRGAIEVTPFFDLVLVWNQGVSYGLFQQSDPAGQLALAVLNVSIALGLWMWLSRTLDRFAAASLGLLIGGAIGNAVDRLIYGAVADFFHLHAFGWSWYVFNLADVAIVAGVAGLLYDSFRPGHKRAQNPD